MAVIRVGKAGGNAGGTEAKISNIDITGATFIWAALSNIFNQATIEDSNGGSTWGLNTWTYGSSVTDGGGGVRGFRLAWCINPTTSANYYVRIPSSTGNYPAISFVAMNDAVDSLEVGNQSGHSTAQGGNTTTNQPGSLTPANASNLMILGCGGDNYGFAVDSGFTIATDGTTDAKQDKIANVHECSCCAWLKQSAATAQNPTWTATTNDYDQQAALAVFKLVASGFLAAAPVIARDAVRRAANW